MFGRSFNQIIHDPVFVVAEAVIKAIAPVQASFGDHSPELNFLRFVIIVNAHHLGELILSGDLCNM